MKNNIKLGLSAVAALALAANAHAFSNQDAIQYSYNGGAFTTAATDTDGDGQISTTITVGGFTLNVVSSQTYPFSGTQAFPNMDLNIQGKGTLIGSLVIEFSSIDFTPVPSGSYVTTTAIADDSFIKGSETTRVGVNPGGDTLFAAGVNSATVGGAATGTFVNTIGAPVAGQTAPYALTLSVNLDQTANNDPRLNNGSISIDTHLHTVPDGGNTLMLLGSALSVLGIGAFRKSRKA